MKKSGKKNRRSVKKTVAKQQSIQSQQDKKDRKAKKIEAQSPATGSPPAQPLQHLDKPGNEHQLRPAPQYAAPDYRGSGKLAGMSALITGGDSGIGRSVAILFAREGANVAICYLEEHADARKTCELIEAEGGKSLAISGDIQDLKFCANSVQQVIEQFGGLNILGQQCGLPGARRRLDRSHAGKAGPDLGHQPLRLPPYVPVGTALFVGR